MNVQLTAEEARVIGCLMEKAVTTPDQYPLTLNALTNACNQKSSRDPVMSLDKGLVQRTAEQLADKHLIRVNEGGRSAVQKYTQRLCGTPMAEVKLSDEEYAVICLLLLRGAQTPGELRSRSGRLFSFADNQHVSDVLKGLIDREDGPIVARLPREPGRLDHEYAHLFSGEVESVSEEVAVSQRAPATSQVGRLDSIEDRLSVLEKALTDLAERLGEEMDLGPTRE